VALFGAVVCGHERETTSMTSKRMRRLELAHASEREPVEKQGGEWIVPAAPTLVVARSPADLLAGLHLRHHIGDAEFQAGRHIFVRLLTVLTVRPLTRAQAR
jgi:hypothetical protein